MADGPTGLVKEAYVLPKNNFLQWMNAIKRILDDTETQSDNIDPTHLSAELMQRLTDQYMQTWQSDL